MIQLSFPAHIEHFAEIGSTNTYLMEQVDAPNSIRIAIADMQTSGRGQNGRSWHSPKGQNIYVSVSLPFQKSAQQVQGLSLAVGTSLIRSLESLGLQELKLKWPNDIFWQGKKLAGILVETTQIQTHSCRVVIGMGINVNMSGEATIDQAWTSLKLISGKDWDRNQLLTLILENLLQDFRLFEKKGYEAFHQFFLQHEL